VRVREYGQLRGKRHHGCEGEINVICEGQEMGQAKMPRRLGGDQRVGDMHMKRAKEFQT
jgi:hypothetical protein